MAIESGIIGRDSGHSKIVNSGHSKIATDIRKSWPTFENQEGLSKVAVDFQVSTATFENLGWSPTTVENLERMSYIRAIVDDTYDCRRQWQLSPDILGKNGPKCPIIATIIFYTSRRAYW